MHYDASAPTLYLRHDDSSPPSHRERGSDTIPVLSAKGIPMLEANKVPKPRASAENEWKHIWDMRCWLVEAAKDSEGVQ